ncbi:MAG: choice-of-anchor M domain-containing protein [Verrucomicrobiales bacterium]|nr:choice-of-anchor M domain-containing protein [Verrucomicrobiales bacterium]
MKTASPSAHLHRTVPTPLMASLLVFAVLLATAGTAWSAAEEPVPLRTGHVDLRIDYDAGRSNLLEIVVSVDDHGEELPAESALLMVAEAAKLQLPGDLPPLGKLGDSLWVVPQSQDPAILFLGLSAENNTPSAFDGPLELRLLEVKGPGQVFFWQSDIGTLEFFFDSANGFGPDDTFPMLVGGHNHGNWGFTTNGIYRLTFQAIGRRVGESTNIFSPPTVFEFHVQPVPTNNSPFQIWQAEQWPDSTDPNWIGPEADPDQDGRRNLEEYALGTDPNKPDSPTVATPNIRVSQASGTRGAEIHLQMRRHRDDLDIVLLTASEVHGPWSALNLAAKELPPEIGVPEFERVLSWTDPLEVAPRPNRFYRVRYQLKTSL